MEAMKAKAQADTAEGVAVLIKKVDALSKKVTKLEKMIATLMPEEAKPEEAKAE